MATLTDAKPISFLLGDRHGFLLVGYMYRGVYITDLYWTYVFDLQMLPHMGSGSAGLLDVHVDAAPGFFSLIARSELSMLIELHV